MSKKKKLKPVPKGYSTVTPSLNTSDAPALIAFIKKAFGAKSRGDVMRGPDGKIMHSEFEIGDSIVMISDPVMEPARPQNLMLYVENVDKTFAKALKAGAKQLMPVEDQFWGDRFGRVEDPAGNRWSIASRIENVSPKELKKRMAALKPPGQ